MTLLSSSHAKMQAFLALSCVGSALVPTIANAQDQQALGGVTVTDTVIEDNQGRQQAGPKATRPLRDTPQTVTILTGEVIEQQNLLTLRDVLSTVPGITFGAGEGGGGYGDSINFRGYSANTDITVDGVRDSAQYTRTDPFNLEQIEVTNGANSVVAGSGSVGGSINLVTKRPLATDQVTVNAGIGTDDYYRGTVDANLRVSDLIAVRLNAMGHRNDIPGRDVENYKRWGFAPAITIGIESPTRLTVQYLHQRDENIPQYGVPYYKSATQSGLLQGASRSGYYGYANVDTQEITVDQLTATFEHEFSDTVSIRNLARWQNVEQLTIVNPPQGTWCLASTGLQATGAACPATTPPGYYLPTGPRGTTRDSRNQLAFNQLDLKAVFETGGIEHTLVFGGAVTWEKYQLESGNSLRNADGTTVGTLPLINIANPSVIVPGPAATGRTYGSNIYTGPVNFIPTARQNGETKNYAVYLFDTMKLIEQVELSVGLRYERNKGWYRADTIANATATSAGTVTTGTKLWNDDELFTYRFGLVYKPIEAVSLYAAYGNSQTPSKSSVNGSCTAATCNVKPESAKNYEIGAKAELFNGGLLLSAAAFRNERDSYRVDSGDPTVPNQQLDGHSRVDGISLGATGKITPAWTITANYTYLDGELIQSVSDKCLANPGTGSCTNTVANPDPASGAELANTPKHSGSLFTTYEFPFGLTLGYGATYQGSFVFALPTATNTTLFKSDPYWVHNATIAYKITDAFSAQVNIKNFTDKLYFTRIRNNGWATPGEGRAAIFSVNYRF
ncbi:MAG: TonB-dependent receptor [Sphingomonas sp.]|nr:TonB-dependent receptor [Sphingomonas sp.]